MKGEKGLSFQRHWSYFINLLKVSKNTLCILIKGRVPRARVGLLHNLVSIGQFRAYTSKKLIHGDEVCFSTLHFNCFSGGQRAIHSIKKTQICWYKTVSFDVVEWIYPYLFWRVQTRLTHRKHFLFMLDIANVIGHAQCHASHKISPHFYNLSLHEAELTQPHTESLLGSTYDFFCINLRKVKWREEILTMKKTSLTTAPRRTDMIGWIRKSDRAALAGPCSTHLSAQRKNDNVKLPNFRF